MPLQPPQHVQRALLDPLVPSLQVGAAAAGLAATTGAAVGLIQSSQPFPRAAAFGVTAFYSGASTFWLRSVALNAYSGDRTKRLELAATGLAGGLSGASSHLLMGGTVRSIYRSSLLIGGVGLAIQVAYYGVARWYEPGRHKKGFFDRVSDLRWLPLRSLTNTEYESMLTEKLSKIEAEIVHVDDELQALKAQTTHPHPDKT